MRFLNIKEELGSKDGIALALMDLGDANYKYGNYEKALEHYKRAVKINENIDNKFKMVLNLRSLGRLYYRMGEYNKALEYYNYEMKLANELNDTWFNFNIFFDRGLVYFQQQDYKRALEYIDKSVKIQLENDSTISLKTASYLFLINKILDKEYNVEEIHALVKEAENIEFELNLRLYELLEDKSLLKIAYNQVQENASAMEDRAKFLELEIPAAIVEEWEKVK